MSTDEILRQGLHAMADATDKIVPGAGESYRKFADENYGNEAQPSLSNLEESPLNRAGELSGLHDSLTCDKGSNGRPCEMCKGANERRASPLNDPFVRREYDTWNLETELDRYRDSYGNDALVREIENFLGERGLY